MSAGGAATDKRQPAFEARVLAAGPSVLARTDQRARIELAVEYGEAATWPQQAHPLGDSRLRMRQSPQHVTADDEIKAMRGEGRIFGVALLQPDRGAALRRFFAGFF